jgi:hypothetical protein
LFSRERARAAAFASRSCASLARVAATSASIVAFLALSSALAAVCSALAAASLALRSGEGVSIRMTFSGPLIRRPLVADRDVDGRARDRDGCA